MTSVHLVTGATGFVGRALLLELLATTADDVVCLVRPAGGVDPRTRLRDALMAAARAYGAGPHVAGEFARRVRVVVADLDGPLPGPRAIDQVWHCGSLLRWRDRDREAVHQTNVDGTARLLTWAATAGAHAFHNLSTAYLAPDGVLTEQPATAGRAQNVFEESKIEAERLVLTAGGFRTTILRPGVVVGHSNTTAVSGRLSGIYGLGFQLLQHARLFGPSGPRLLLDPTATVNLVPVDRVAREAVVCGLGGRAAGIYHLTAARPTTVKTLVTALAQALRVGPVEFVDRADQLSEVDRLLASRLAGFATYLRGHRTFDRHNTDQLVGPPPVDEPLPLDHLCQWYADMIMPLAYSR